MAGPKLDGAGTQKIKTLEDSLVDLQRLHGIVERAAMEVKNGRPLAPVVMQLKRAATPLIGILKGQFGMISDQVVAMLLSATRGGNDQQKLRAMREGIAQIRTALEIAVNRTMEAHTVDEDKDAKEAQEAEERAVARKSRESRHQAVIRDAAFERELAEARAAADARDAADARKRTDTVAADDDSESSEAPDAAEVVNTKDQ